jgi:hypothetical protein
MKLRQRNFKELEGEKDGVDTDVEPPVDSDPQSSKAP